MSDLLSAVDEIDILRCLVRDLFVNIKIHSIISDDDFPRVIAFEKEQP